MGSRHLIFIKYLAAAGFFAVMLGAVPSGRTGGQCACFLSKYLACQAAENER